MILNIFAFIITLTLPTRFEINDRIEVGSFQYESQYDNMSGSIDVYYSLGGSPSNPLSIQVRTQNEVLFNHQMSPNDFYSGVVDTSGILGGNIYKWSFDIDNINHTNIYYFSLVNDTGAVIPYSGSSIEFIVIANVNDFVNDYDIGFNDGYEEGYEDGEADGFINGENSKNTFNLDWLTAIFSAVNMILSVEIFYGFKLWYIVGIIGLLGVVYGVMKLWR